MKILHEILNNRFKFILEIVDEVLFELEALKKLFAFNADKFVAGVGLDTNAGFAGFGIVFSGYAHLVSSCLYVSFI
jgi:hypothetical protein